MNSSNYRGQWSTSFVKKGEMPAMMEDPPVWYGSDGQGKEQTNAEGGSDWYADHCQAVAAEQSGHSVAMDGPFFSSNLKYYPDLPQPPYEVPYGTCKKFMDSFKRKQQQKQKREQERETRKMQQLLGERICQWTQPLETGVESLIGMNDLQLSSLLLACHLKKTELDPGEGSAQSSEEVPSTPNRGQQQKQRSTYCSYNAMPAMNAPKPRELPQPPTKWC